MKQVTDTAPTIIWITQHRLMREAGHVAHIIESIQIVNEKYEGKRSLGRRNCRRKDNKQTLKWQ
jgi:hypothetical protein